MLDLCFLLEVVLMRHLLGAAAALAFLITLSSTVDAKQCRDAKGKFVKCQPTAMSTMGGKKRCRDAKGHFVKCKTK